MENALVILAGLVAAQAVAARNAQSRNRATRLAAREHEARLNRRIQRVARIAGVPVPEPVEERR